MSFIVFIGTLLYFGVKIEPADRTVTQSSALRCITYRRNGRAPNGNLRARPRAERLRISGFDKRPRSRSTHLRCVWGEHDNCGLRCHYCERVSGIVGNRSSDATHISAPLNLGALRRGPLQLLSFLPTAVFLLAVVVSSRTCAGFPSSCPRPRISSLWQRTNSRSATNSLETAWRHGKQKPIAGRICIHAGQHLRIPLVADGTTLAANRAALALWAARMGSLGAPFSSGNDTTVETKVYKRL
jgi:hypothetical protein